MPGEPRDLNIPKHEPTVKQEFEVKNEEMMRLLISVVKRNAQDGMSSLDLGCGRGWIDGMMLLWVGDSHLICVDQDEAELRKLRHTKDTYDREPSFMQKAGNKIDIVQEDLNLFLENNDLHDLDLVIINTALHEINDPEKREEYLIKLFKKLKSMTKPTGKIIIGDFYFGENATLEQISAYQEFQRKTAGHADAAVSYVSPGTIELILQDPSNTGLKREFMTTIPATTEIDRRYYIMELVHEVA